MTECPSQLPDLGPVAHGECQVPLQLFPEQRLWGRVSACQGNEVPSPLCAACPAPGTVLNVCV